MQKALVIGCPGSGKSTFAAPMWKLSSLWSKQVYSHNSRGFRYVSDL